MNGAYNYYLRTQHIGYIKKCGAYAYATRWFGKQVGHWDLGYLIELAVMFAASLLFQ